MEGSPTHHPRPHPPNTYPLPSPAAQQCGVDQVRGGYGAWSVEEAGGRAHHQLVQGAREAR